jgi:hypothetical protein
MNKQLQNKLKAYSALTAAATLATAGADAQVKITETNYFGGFGSHNIDINGDGVNDFAIHVINWAENYSNPGLQGAIIQMEVLGSNNILGASNYYAARLTPMEWIGSPRGFGYYSGLWNGGFSSVGANTSGIVGGMLGAWGRNGTAAPFQWGNFVNVENGLIGVQFEAAGNYHYGWVRISIGEKSNAFRITAMAYEQTPDKGLYAELGLNTVENESKFAVVANESEMTISSDASLMNANVEVFNIQGQVVATKKIVSNKTTISNSFANGIYIVRITDAKGKAITRKVSL